MKKTVYPFPIFLSLSRRCNFSCSYCYTDSGPNIPEDSYVLRNWRSLLNEMSGLGVLEIRLSGGEPLLLREIRIICETIHELGLLYTIISNGSLIKRHLRWLKETPPSTLWLSYHPEYSTGQQFIEILKTALRSLPNVGVHLFSTEIVKSPEFLIRIAKTRVNRIKVLNQTKLGRCQSRSSRPILSRNDAKELANRLREYRKFIPLEIRFESPTLRDGIKGRKSCVLFQRPLLTINEDGTISTCCALSENANFSSLQQESLSALIKRITNGESFRTLPCASVIPGIESGRESCPLHLGGW